MVFLYEARRDNISGRTPLFATATSNSRRTA